MDILGILVVSILMNGCGNDSTAETVVETVEETVVETVVETVEEAVEEALPECSDAGNLTIVSTTVDEKTIRIMGCTGNTNEDVVFIVTQPDEIMVEINQKSPDLSGRFDIYISVGPLWKQNGKYTVTAQQGNASPGVDSVEVEIQNKLIVK